MKKFLTAVVLSIALPAVAVAAPAAAGKMDCCKDMKAKAQMDCCKDMGAGSMKGMSGMAGMSDMKGMPGMKMDCCKDMANAQAAHQGQATGQSTTPQVQQDQHSQH